MTLASVRPDPREQGGHDDEQEGISEGVPLDVVLELGEVEDIIFACFQSSELGLRRNINSSGAYSRKILRKNVEIYSSRLTKITSAHGAQ